MHHDGNMIIHILIDIAQETTRDDADASKRDTDKIHPLVAFRKCNLTRLDHSLVCELTLESRDQAEFIEQGSAGEFDRMDNQGYGGYIQSGHHRASNIVFRIGDEFVDKNVVVCRVANCAPDDADGEGQRGDGGDKVVWADDRRDDGGRDYDPSDTEASYDQKTPELMQVIGSSTGKGTDS